MLGRRPAGVVAPALRLGDSNGFRTTPPAAACCLAPLSGGSSAILILGSATPRHDWLLRKSSPWWRAAPAWVLVPYSTTHPGAWRSLPFPRGDSALTILLSGAPQEHG